MALLERDSFLQQLSNFLDKAAAGRGTLVFLGGEAGVGKTALVQAFTSSLPQAVRRAAGACDPLSTPRPLGPLLDAASALGVSTSEETSRSLIFQHVLASFNLEPTVVVFEDVHWADEATLDLLRFVGRRIGATKTLLVATYRDHEINLQHPLRLVLGDSATLPVQRLSLPHLSLEAVRHLADGKEVDAEELYIQTGGNPFFVTEILASDTPGLPATVRDAVLARAARVSKSGRAVLEAAAVIGSRVEPWLLSEVVSVEMATLDECLTVGILQALEHDVAFRHELARQAILATIPPYRQQVLHQLVLKALEALPTQNRDPARLAHHAEAAKDTEAVLEYAPAAARRAAELSAHREAAAQYARALRFADALPLEEQARLLEDHAYECYLTDQIKDARQARQGALDLWKHLGRRREQGDTLRWMSRLHWFSGQKAEAEQYAVEAVATLEALPPGPELAMAYSNRAQLHMLANEGAEAVREGLRAIELAEKLNATETLVHALNNVGSAQLLAHEEVGWEQLEKSLRLAQENNLQEHAARAFTNLGTLATQARLYAKAMGYLEAGLEYVIEHDLDSWRLYMTAWRARAHFEQGNWARASEDARWVLAHYKVSPISKIPALAVLGHIRVRRGDSEAAPLLGEALDLAMRTAELQRIAPVAAARAEAAWLQGNLRQVLAEVKASYQLAHRHNSSWTLGELGFWMWRAGSLPEPPMGAAEPFALHMRGDWRAAADAWHRLGCPYEEALALADGDVAAQKAALELFKGLGANPAVQHLTQHLRNLGIRGIPRGQRPSTLSNPAGLTRRELEVLNLVAQGMTNTEIAERLHRSEKTIGHQVSSILAKLEVKNRTEAVRKALQRSILSPK